MNYELGSGKKKAADCLLTYPFSNKSLISD
jgi:hypothetical protein